jgi:hypothetical protein
MTIGQIYVTIFIVCLMLSCVWLTVYLWRSSMVIWAARQAVINGKRNIADQILTEARLERWISLDEETSLRLSLNLPLDELPAEVPPLDLKSYLDRLYRFFISKRG